MLNTLGLNNNSLNSHLDFIGEVLGSDSSSFDSSIKTKYSFKSSTGIYFNFNSICIEGKKYGNILLNHNFDDVAEKEVYKYSNSFKNGGVIYNERYNQKIFDIEIRVISDSIENLEKEINDIKSFFEIGGEFFKVEKNGTFKTSVKFEDLSVSRYILTGTIVKVKFISVDPFWKTVNSTTLKFEGNVNSFVGSINLVNTKIKTNIKCIMYIGNLTGVINELNLNIGGFPIVVQEVLSDGSSIVLDGNSGLVYLNGVKKKFLGQFRELEINTPYSIEIDFAGGGSVDDFDFYITYNNNQL